MSRRFAARLAVPLAAGTALAAACAPNGSAQTPGASTLTFNELAKSTTTAFADNGKKGLTPGDTIELNIPFTDAAGKRVGIANAACSVTRASKSGEPDLICQGVFPLADGDIAVFGRVTPGVDHLAVVGGTGAYAGARGTMTSTDTKTGATDVIALLP
jgi:hypothetical protein